MFALMWLLLLGLLGYLFHDVLQRQNNPNVQVQMTQSATGQYAVHLQRNRAGHYVTRGQLNGFEVDFMLDTGATDVAIPLHIAQRIGLPAGRTVSIQTANGITQGYQTSAITVSIGPLQAQNITATITPGLQTDEILLGMSFLKHISFTQQGTELILRPMQ